MTRFLLVAAFLASGCEQLKAPKKLKELEGRVDELTAQVEKLGGKPGGAKARRAKAKPKHDDQEKSDKTEDADAKDGEGHGKEADGHAAPKEGDGEAKPAAAEGDEHLAADKPTEGTSEAKHDARSEEKPDEADAKPEGHGEPAGAHGEPADAGTDKAASKDERALDDIAKLVADTTGKKAKDKGKDDEPRAGKEAKDPKEAHAHWGYTAKDGPPVWGSLDPAWRGCETGKAQSPVDIEPKPGNASPIVFHYRPTAGTIVDNGHTLQVDLEEGSWIEIADHTYQLVQFHFHTPSEHTIAGEHYPLEAHLVHKDSRGKLAVIGVLFDLGAESKPLGSLWTKWPKKTGAPAKLPRPFDPAQLLPETRTVFRYAGSLTTPPCSEGVIWNVMRRAMTDSKANLDLFGTHYKINARETRPLNDRKIE